MKYSIGEMIHQTRQNRKMTQEEFSSRLGVTPQAVSKWERDISLPDITLVQGICSILGMSANELLGTQMEPPITEGGDAVWQKEIKSSMIAEPMFLEVGRGCSTQWRKDWRQTSLHRHANVLRKKRDI